MGVDNRGKTAYVKPWRFLQRTMNYGLERQLEVYAAGLRGEQPLLPVSYAGLEAKAKEVLTPEAFDYVAGGAGSEDTMRANLDAFARHRIVPRMLTDVSKRDLSIELLGLKMPAPVLLAPIGVLGIVHSDAEIAVGRAAAGLDLPIVLSTAASKSMEEVAQAGGPRWFQLYWPRVPELAASFVQRAERAGYGAIVLTLDTHVLGWRARDIQRAYLPFLHGQGLANYFTDPVFRSALPKPPEEDPAAAIRYWTTIYSHSALTWEDLAFLRDHAKLPILLKGILHPEDAARAVDCGIDGIIVSNHGGRQVDGAIAALDALPGIVERVAGRIPILFDSGIRTGADAVKALALGAKAVLLGRPYVWGLALAGEQGVREVLRNFLADLELTLALSGQTTVRSLDSSILTTK